MTTMMMMRTTNRTTSRQSLENPRNRANELMSWWEAFVWGTLIVAVRLGLLIAGYNLIPYFTAAT
jgi:hypothetical protein